MDELYYAGKAMNSLVSNAIDKGVWLLLVLISHISVSNFIWKVVNCELS